MNDVAPVVTRCSWNGIILYEDTSPVLQVMRSRMLINRITLSLILLQLCPLLILPIRASAEEISPRIIAFGDSLTSGLGVSADESYPAQLQRRLRALNFPHRVINAGVSGDTTAGGLRRVPWILNSKPDWVILELGANDGLRGLSLEQTKNNLDLIIRRLRQADVNVLLAGMKLPPNYGHEYTAGFEAIFPALAEQHRIPFIPFFLDGVAASATLNQPDGIHPTAEGYRTIVEHVLKTLLPLLKESSRMQPNRK